MTNEERIKTLNRLIGALKTKLTRTELLLNKPIDSIDALEIKRKSSELESIKVNFEERQTEIESLVSDEGIDAQYELRGDFEDRLSALYVRIQRTLELKEPSTSEIQSIASSNSRNSVNNPNNQSLAPTSAIAHLINESAINLKLPALNLPTFSGSYEKWPGFSDVFKSSVHNDRRYSDAQRLVYLRSCLTGKASDKIESLETTDANYQVAWRILEKYYDDPYLVINNHIKAFFELSNCANASATSIGDLLDTATKHYRALEALNKPFLEAFPIYAIVSKLDPQTRLKWKEHVQLNNSPTMEELLEFLHCRERVLETNKVTKNDKQEKGAQRNDNQNRGNNPKSQSNTNRGNSSYATHKAFCHICKGAHFTQTCEKLTNAQLPERLDMIKNLKLCINCLRSNHTVAECKATLCKTCDKKHHTLLHKNSDEKPAQVNFATLHNVASSQILLSTAIVHILDQEGRPHACRALLDNGSQVHFITENLAKKLGLKQFEHEIPLGGVNQMNSTITKITHSVIESRLNKYRTQLTFLITPEINEQAPSEPIKQIELKIPSNIHLADPQFHVPGKIDILLGAEIFLKLLCVGQLSIANNNVTLQKTHLGWILGGKIPGKKPSKVATCNLTFDLLDKKVSRFWEIENVPSKRIMSNEERKCLEHYMKNTTRESETGKYIVRQPFKEDVNELGESYNRALKQFYALERTLLKVPEHKEKYSDFMKEYELLGHMSENTTHCHSDSYFIPHHSIIKESSLTTKLRVVFNASSKTSTGKSLNDVLMVGPNVQEDLFSLIARFRSHKYAITADIEKMYRQIIIHPNDRKFQKILWRHDTNCPIKIFDLNTVTYGTSSASFLATQSLIQLADDEGASYPNASIALKEDFYMDDVLTGDSDIDKAKNLVNELIDLTEKGGMHLRQWASNEPSLISSLATKNNESNYCLNLGDTTKTLGVYWNPKSDLLTYSVAMSQQNLPITKRTILSLTAQLFDPLGLLGPVILIAKILLQSLWLLRIDWDESVPQDIHTAWCAYRDELSLVKNIKISRKIVSNDYCTLQLHGFCDASEKAYGACLYLRSTDQTGENFTHLICSKSRVAPLKKLSLPRLELSAALLLANLFESIIHALRRLNIEKTILWSDSTIAIHWIRSSPHTLKTFESNRVNKIQEITSNCEWRHIRSEHNPADLISRGLTPKEILNNTLWFNGPVWIDEREENWPVSIIKSHESSKKQETLVNLAYNNNNDRKGEMFVSDIEKTLFKQTNSFAKILRIIAYCQRFVDIKIRKMELNGILSPDELNRAMNCVIKIIQRGTFFKEIKTLEKEGRIEGRLSSLNPFIDSDGILRVGGRLDKSNLTYNQKHPMLLPKDHDITEMIVREQHVKLMHAGSQSTVNAIRNNFWIVDIKNKVKKVINKCVICRRAKPKFPTYVMSELPKNRVVFERAFKHTGVDFCGPFFIKEKKHRNRTKVKIYVAVFVCFSTKAVHIEIVSDLTTEAFLASLKRFFSRRGLSSDLYSDNATNFRGTKREIDEIYKFLNDKKNINEITGELANQGRINWHFIPPRSPHFGGLWEAAVKSFKHHFKRVIGETLLTYEQFTTFATEVEGILNSRPLTTISSDPNDFIALTPGHFLIGDSLTNVPEHNLLDLQINKLSSWQQIQQMKQHFWTRWNKEYLNELTVRKGWHKGSTTEIKIGTLVTIRDDSLPPMRWSLGRIINIHPGADGIIRVVTVKTSSSEYKRSVKNLSPLPIDVV